MTVTSLWNRKAVLAAAGILIVGAGAWGVVTLSKGKKTTLAKEYSVEALNKAASQDPGKIFERAHEAMERGNLTEEQRHELRENVHSVMEAQMDRRLDEYFAANETQRRVLLDRDIAEMQVRMKEWEQRRTQREREGSSRGPDGRPRGQAGPVAAGAGGGGTANAGPGNAPNADRRGDRRGPPSREQRKLRSESRDPDRTARRMAYFTALRKRAEERGIQMPMPGRSMGMGRP